MTATPGIVLFVAALAFALIVILAINAVLWED